MCRFLAFPSLLTAILLGSCPPAFGQVVQRVVDLPTRPGVTQRVLYLGAANAQATVILFPGGHGGLQLTPDGDFGWGKGNFLVRTRKQFADHGLTVAVLDAPSDRQREPYLEGFRQRPEHVTDIQAVIAWLKQPTPVPVWLVGTSRGTQSAAFVATELSGSQGGPDGLVLTSTILVDAKSRPVPALPLEKLTIPVLVVHHEQDGCKACPYSAIPRLMEKLQAASRKEVLTFKGGLNRGDPCEAMAYHGFNGLEDEVVAKMANWIQAR